MSIIGLNKNYDYKKGYTNVSIMELQSLDWHDACIENLSIDFSSNEIIIKVGIYNEMIEDYDILEYLFADLTEFFLSEIDVQSFKYFEIYSTEVFIYEEQKTVFEMTMITELGKANAILKFSFVNAMLRI